MKLIFLTFLHFFWTKSVRCQSNPCVEALIAKSSIIGNRFSISQLHEVCTRDITWQNEAVDVGLRSSKKALTPRQMAWLDQIRSCEDLLCICNNIDLCGNVVHQIEIQVRGIGPGIGGTGEPWVARVRQGINGRPGGHRGSRGRGRERGHRGRNRRNGSFRSHWPEEDETTLRQKRQSPPERFKLRRAVRKEYRMLTEEERKRFHDAILKLKHNVIDGLGKYDIIVHWHTPEESPGAHFGPAFLPFHRELLKQSVTNCFFNSSRNSRCTSLP